MGYGFKHGAAGGAPLNFSVEAYASQDLLPEKAKDNAVAVITETAISSWVFSVEAPATTETGMVWFLTGASSAVSFNAFKKNGVMVYPISAKQYIGEAWVDKTAKVFQKGVWTGWWNGELYMDGNWYTEATGNWVSVGKAAGSDSYSGRAPDVQNNADSFKLYYASGVNASGMYYLEDKIDLTNYTSLHFEGELNPYDGVENRARVQIWSDIGQYTLTNVVAYLAKSGLSNGTGAIDVSALTGEYHVGFNLYSRNGNASTIICKKLYLT